MSWGQAAKGASTTGEGASYLGNLVDGYSEPASSGFSIEPANTAGTVGQTGSGMGPTIENTADLVNNTPNIYNESAANLRDWGTEAPSALDKVVNLYGRFNKGSNQNLTETYNKFGNNPETYGAAYGLVNKMAGSGKPAGAAPITTNISYQQPVNPYLAKRGRY